MRARKKYEAEFKEIVVKDYLESNKSYEQVSSEYSINSTVIHKWVKIYEENGIEGFKVKRGVKGSFLDTKANKVTAVHQVIEKDFPKSESIIALKDQNTRLKILVAEKELKYQILQEILKKTIDK